ncbi:hypothetical protein D3C80_363230 [compost metagenome]
MLGGCLTCRNIERDNTRLAALFECGNATILSQRVFSACQKCLAVSSDGETFKSQVVSGAACFIFIQQIGFRQFELANKSAVEFHFTDRGLSFAVAFAGPVECLARRIKADAFRIDILDCERLSLWIKQGIRFQNIQSLNASSINIELELIESGRSLLRPVIGNRIIDILCRIIIKAGNTAKFNAIEFQPGRQNKLTNQSRGLVLCKDRHRCAEQKCSQRNDRERVAYHNVTCLIDPQTNSRRFLH